MLFFHLFVLPSGRLPSFLRLALPLSPPPLSGLKALCRCWVRYCKPSPSQSPAADWWIPHFPKQPWVDDWQEVHSHTEFKWEASGEETLSVSNTHTHTHTHWYTHILIDPDGRNVICLWAYWTDDEDLTLPHPVRKRSSIHWYLCAFWIRIKKEAGGKTNK